VRRGEQINHVFGCQQTYIGQSPYDFDGFDSLSGHHKTGDPELVRLGQLAKLGGASL
jgi:hypothetical protein